MLLSLNWLGRYVDLGDKSPQEIANDLTMRTAEIEDILPFGQELSELVVGEVVECGRHPDADKLSLTLVEFGGDEPLPVVCGAPNVAKGQKIAYIGVGKRLPDGTKIKKSKLRGQLSMGMICSERELGLSDEHEGIMVLDPAAVPGRPLTDYLPIRDTLLEIDNKSITHRPDLWGHYGFARELAAMYGRSLGDPLEGLDPNIPMAGETLEVDIKSSQGACQRYCGLVLRDVQVAPAPEWMRFLLLAVGQRPLNNIVDLTNFLLLDLGQPMHAFDMDRLRGLSGRHQPGISVRLAKDGETITTLDAMERQLGCEDLLICDGQGPVALAGIMGGEHSMVESDSTSVFLESANFDASTIRRSSMRLGLRSESSARFEKSLDPALCELAAKKFAALLPEVSPGAHATGPITDPSGWRYEPKHVVLRCSRANRILGLSLDREAITDFLEPLGFGMEVTDEDAWSVALPSFRASKDISIEEDLIEELGRCYGYDNIPPEAPLEPVTVPFVEPELTLSNKLKHIFAHDSDALEAKNYTFLADEHIERLGLGDLPYVHVTNAIASHLSHLQRDVMPGLLISMADNLRREKFVSLFEVDKGYYPEVRGEILERDGVSQSLPFEVLQLVHVVADRNVGGPHPYYRVRGHLEHALKCVGRPQLSAIRLEAPPPWMHPGRTAAFVDPDDHGRVVAYVGDVHPEILERLALDLPNKGGGVAALCIDLRQLLAVPRQEIHYRCKPRFPDQPVDLAILAPKELEAVELTRLLESANPRILREVKLFEVYRGKGLPEGKKSLNFTAVLGSDKRTLTTKDEERFIGRVRELVTEIGCELRG